MQISTHNGTITVNNPATGNHRTFTIKTAQGGNLKGKRIVALLIGSDNTQDYKGFGFVDGLGFITVWNKYKGTEFDKLADILEHPDKYNKLEYLHEGRCIRCNRKLTHPDSIKLGIGPECLNKS